MGKAAKAGKGSWADKVGSKLGDETYKFVNEDLPEAAEFAKKDYARMKEALADSAIGRTVANLPNKVQDAKEAMQRKATELKHDVAAVGKGATEIRDQAAAKIAEVRDNAGKMADAALERASHEVANVKEQAVETVHEVREAVNTAVDETVGFATDTAKAAYQEAAELKESAKRRVAGLRSMAGSLF